MRGEIVVEGQRDRNTLTSSPCVRRFEHVGCRDDSEALLQELEPLLEDACRERGNELSVAVAGWLSNPVVQKCKADRASEAPSERPPRAGGMNEPWLARLGRVSAVRSTAHGDNVGGWCRKPIRVR